MAPGLFWSLFIYWRKVYVFILQNRKNNFNCRYIAGNHYLTQASEIIVLYQRKLIDSESFHVESNFISNRININLFV